jgi:hypothetical protein
MCQFCSGNHTQSYCDHPLNNRRILVIGRGIQNVKANTGKAKWRFPTYRPGDVVPVSGLYNVVDQEGRPTGYQRSEMMGGVFEPDSRGAGFKLRRLNQLKPLSLPITPALLALRTFVDDGLDSITVRIDDERSVVMFTVLRA